MKTQPLHTSTRVLPSSLERDRGLAEDIVLFAVALRKARDPLSDGLVQAREGEAACWAGQWRRVSPDERCRALDRRFSPGEASANALRELGSECGEALMGAVMDATPLFLRFVLDGSARQTGRSLSGFAVRLASRLVRECVGPQPSRSVGVKSVRLDGA